MPKRFIPFIEYNNLKIVYAFLNGTKCSFILDPEQPTTVVNSNYFPIKKSVSEHDHLQVFLPKLNLYGLKSGSPYVEALDLSTYEQNGRMIHGIFGQDMINGFDLSVTEGKFVLSS